MLDVGSFHTRDCQGLSRRAFVRAALAAPFAWGLSPRLGDTATVDAPKAKSILLVWLGGAPSPLDTFDPKPKATQEFPGPSSTIQTRSPGVRFTELLPKLAARSQKFSLVRTNVNYDGDHLIAGSIALTGFRSGPRGYQPNFGSILARHRGGGRLPSFISLAKGPIGDGRGPLLGYGGGAWGKVYDPFMVWCDEEGHVDIPDLKLLDGLPPARLSDRRLVLQELDRLRRQADQAKADHWGQLYQRAYALLNTPAARQSFDLSRV